MAVIPLCARLLVGQESACVPLKRKYFQQAVVINKADIDTLTVVRTDFDVETPECKYNVSFTLKEGTTGYRFSGPENGNSFFGRYNKTTSDLGFASYQHEVQMLVVGADEDSKCILESLDKGSYIVALQFSDGTVEIYGVENGLSTGDYTYSVSENGGGSMIILSSNEQTPESYLPLVYVSASPGSETVDFDDLFANPASS